MTADREATAARLLRSSAARSYDPDVDIDWSAPDEPGKVFHPEELVSLYGTPLWAGLTERQRVDLGRHELAWILAQGIVAELGLMGMLVRVATMGDPTSGHVQYALTEVADECRHSTMFSRALEQHLRPGDAAIPRLPRSVAGVLRFVTAVLPIGTVSWAGTLIVEDILDRLQRETMADERVQPKVRMVNRIHVLEEARHISYARDELRRCVADAGPIGLAASRVTLGLLAWANPRLGISAFAYRAVGLDPREARRQALANPVHREVVRRHAERLVHTFDEVGLIKGRLTTALWRRSFMLGPGR
ncbi:MAG TPA: diiron oxygenase [Pseudonocardia sp.]|nr:diiron oxygenase [Pseudonocardia sp.]